MDECTSSENIEMYGHLLMHAERAESQLYISMTVVMCILLHICQRRSCLMSVCPQHSQESVDKIVSE